GGTRAVTVAESDHFLSPASGAAADCPRSGTHACVPVEVLPTRVSPGRVSQDETGATRSRAYVSAMLRAVALEAVRRSYLTAGPSISARELVRPDVLASWERSRRHEVEPDAIAARFVGHGDADECLAGCAEEVFEASRCADQDVACSLVLLDSS